MTVAADSGPVASSPASSRFPDSGIVILSMLAVLAALMAARDVLPWAVAYPKAVLPLTTWIKNAWTFSVTTPFLDLFTLKDATRFFARLLTYPMNIVQVVLTPSLRRPMWMGQSLPSIPWITLTGLVAIFAHYAGGWRLAALIVAAGCYFAFFGLWNPTMETLASVSISVPISATLGIVLGVWAFRSRRVSAVLRVFSDIMQTLPIWSYFIPIIVLFGISPVGALVATMIFALPPMIRVTELALHAVPAELIDFGRMAGSTRRQLMWMVRVPAARDALMLGLNQVIMLSLNLVILCSTMGARGLGFHVWTSLNRSNLGAGLEYGMAIVVLAIVMDRLSRAVAAKRPSERRVTGSFIADRPYLALAIGFAVVSILIAWLVPHAYVFPEKMKITTAPLWNGLITWININLFDYTEAVRDFTLLNILAPIRNLLLGLPWVWVVGAIAAAGYGLGGWRLATFAGGLILAVALTGLWEKAIITVHECLIAIVVCYVAGFPLAVWAARSDRVWSVLQPLADMLQTMPSFIFLLPFVILFRTGEFTAILIIVSFAIVPVIRYTAEGLRAVPAHIVEAARAHGANNTQLLFQVELPLALPQLILGLNQTIMMALSMLVITAYVGTRDLGQETYAAMIKGGDVAIGFGVVGGLSVCAIAIAADRLVRAAAERMGRRLGVG